MARVDPIRRAEIGREKRARTRAQLVAAANSLYAVQAVESVTVDDIVREAGVAKGTFYVHFTGLDALNAAVAEALVRSLDELLQPVRLSVDDPAVRIAYGCSSSRELPRSEASPELYLEIVVGIVLQLTRVAGQCRLSSRDRDPAVIAILQAIGLDARRAKSVLALLPAPEKDAAQAGPGRAKPRARRTPSSAA
jgi:AcrR family transcriptional regulator